MDQRDVFLAGRLAELLEFLLPPQEMPLSGRPELLRIGHAREAGFIGHTGLQRDRNPNV